MGLLKNKSFMQNRDNKGLFMGKFFFNFCAVSFLVLARPTPFPRTLSLT